MDIRKDIHNERKKRMTDLISWPLSECQSKIQKQTFQKYSFLETRMQAHTYHETYTHICFYIYIDISEQMLKRETGVLCKTGE